MKGDKLKKCPAFLPSGRNKGTDVAKIYYTFWKTASDFARMLLDTQHIPGKNVGGNVYH